jgi:hypothetical protein
MGYRETLLAMTPTAYWRLGEPSGTVAMDERYAFAGTYVASPTLSVAGLLTGDPNTAMTGTGSSSMTIPAMGAMSAWTICFWMKANGISGDFAGIYGTTGDVIDIATFANNQLGFFDGAWTNGIIPFAVGDTNFWVLTFAGTTISIYKDGELAYQNPARGRALANVGAVISRTIGGLFSTATLDEFAIFPRAITQAEVTSLFTAGGSGAGSSAGLVTLAQVKARIFPVGLVDTGEDTLLAELIGQSTDYIQGLAGRTFVPEPAATYVVDTASGSVIEVRRGIRSVTALGVATSDQPDSGGTYTSVALSDVLLRPNAMERPPNWPPTRILLRGTGVGRLATAMNAAQITGDFGFAAVPPVVQAIALDAVAAAYTAKAAGDSDTIGADGSPVAVWARMFAQGTEQRATLDRFRAGAGIA